jgi:N-acetylglucosaminyldiphosphoundecaprenol N-acetyl-beta-D-mannosaminyltransferase
MSHVFTGRLTADKKAPLLAPSLSTTRERAHPIALLGVLFDNVTIDETVRLIEQMIESREPHYLATANVDFLVQARHDVELRRILMDAHLVLCDGTPLLWASRLLGNPLPERVAGSDLVPLLLNIAALRKYRIFFLGGSPEVSERAVQRLQVQHPDLIIAGHYSPPFNQLLEMNHDEIVRRIKQAQPDFLFVSFGCPKQEKWIAMHYRTLGVPVSVGVGATIDFLAGQAARAPRWMRRAGLEWVFRMAQEPRRLFRRYMRDLGLFTMAMSHQVWQMRMGSRPTLWRSSAAPAARQPQGTGQRVRLPEQLDVETVRRCAILCEDALANSSHCLIEADHVRKIDSTGIGMLMRIQKRARISGRQLILVAPTLAVRRALKLMRLEDFFVVARDIVEAERLIARERDALNVLPADESPDQPERELRWAGEVTASNIAVVWNQTRQFLDAADGGPVHINLSAVRFMDSSGVGLMLRAKRQAREKGLNLFFTKAHPNVRNVLRISKLENLIHTP